jgi:hypothetical protein
MGKKGGRAPLYSDQVGAYARLTDLALLSVHRDIPVSTQTKKRHLDFVI